jgi:hypothetical protein
MSMYVLVLNDGQTYTDLTGSLLLRIDDSLADSPDLDAIVQEAADLRFTVGWKRPANPLVEIVTAFG